MNDITTHNIHVAYMTTYIILYNDVRSYTTSYNTKETDNHLIDTTENYMRQRSKQIDVWTIINEYSVYIHTCITEVIFIKVLNYYFISCVLYVL